MQRAAEAVAETDEEMGEKSEVGGMSQVAKGKKKATSERQKKRKRVSDTGPALKKRAETAESGSTSGSRVNDPYVMILFLSC